MTIKEITYMLVGPHEGKTMSVNGHEFVDGRRTFIEEEQTLENLTRIFSFYGAFPDNAVQKSARKIEVAKPLDLKTLTQTERPAAAAAITSLMAPPTTDEVAKAFERALNDDQDAPAAKVEPVSKDQKVSLAEAIGLLDPAVDDHWTSSNLPSLDHLATVMGKKVARDDVEALADGYTRAKARAVRNT